jgi:alpha-beta hydrolase superfamily lysophospholipase
MYIQIGYEWHLTHRRGKGSLWGVMKTIYFDSDGIKLAGTLHLPELADPPLVIGCHGLLANRQSQKQITLAKACNRVGMAYFRFDHRGCGDSDGELSKETSLEARCRDLYHAVRAMKQCKGTGPLVGLFGSSFGGTVVLAYAAQYESPTLITYAAPIDSSSIHHSNIRYSNGHAPPLELMTDALSFDITPRLNTIKDILIVHSENDETVPLSHAQQIYATVNDPKHLTVFKGGDHRMSNTGHQVQFERQFIAWLMKSD